MTFLASQAQTSPTRKQGRALQSMRGFLECPVVRSPLLARRAGVRIIAVAMLVFFTEQAADSADKLAGASRAKAARQLSTLIDERIEARLSAEQVEPAAIADDAEYFRRVWLHLAGTIPPVSEVRRFLADDSPDKRDRIVDELLSRPSFVRQFITFWRRAWLPEADTDVLVQARVPALENWLRQQLLAERRYDELVRDLLTVPIPKTAAAGAGRMNDTENGPLAFFLAKEAKPENLAASASRAFLGVRLDCAQCHDHPFDNWKRDQFWSFAAFFAGLERGDNDQPSQAGLLHEITDRHDLPIPDTDRIVGAAYLDGTEPKWKSRGGRQLLADWITAPKNPYFAKAAVNRLWGHLFGIGIIDPVDDFSPANAASHPELLEELAKAFIAQEYDVKFLLRAIIGSQAYQRTSRQPRNETSLQLFAHMPVQGLSPEQLVRSLAPIVGTEIPNATPNPQFAFVPPDEISTIFTRPGESPTQRQTTILQALTLMNGRATATALDVENGSLLAAVIDFPAMTVAERIETLYLATLSRPPRVEESSRLERYVAAAAEARAAYGDILWALLNSTEFGCNH